MKKLVSLLLMLFLCSVFFTQCKKGLPEEFDLIELGATTIVNVYSTTCDIQTELVQRGPMVFEQHGHCWSTNPQPDIEDSCSRLKRILEPKIFESNIKHLLSGTKYYIRPYLSNEDGVYYGQEYTFMTDQQGAPYAFMKKFEEVTTNSFVSYAEIIDDGGAEVTERGFIWGTSSEIDTLNCLGSIPSGYGMGTFQSRIRDLTDGTRYYVKAYARNEFGIRLSDTFSVRTFQAMLPNVITYKPIVKSSTSALLKGFLETDGGSPIEARGFVVNKAGDPDIDNYDFKTENGTELGFFSHLLDSLEVSSGYYYKAYAINSKGVAYGMQKNFVVNAENTPVVYTYPVTDISFNSASCGGSIGNSYDSDVSARGCVWNINGNPTLLDNMGMTVDSFGNFPFNSNITNLDQLQTYRIRAYATNEYGTGYGNEVEFSTLYDYCYGTKEIEIGGDSYPVEIIGKQCWMAKNLNAGTQIISDQLSTENGILEKYCYDDDSAFCNEMGALYYWDEIMNYSANENNKGICPEGWHIPNDDDWIKLECFVDSYFDEYNHNWNIFGWRGIDAAIKLKVPFINWGVESDSCNKFAALPSGYMIEGEGYYGYTGQARFWTSSQVDNDYPIFRELEKSRNTVRRFYYDQNIAVSVRCIKN